MMAKELPCSLSAYTSGSNSVHTSSSNYAHALIPALHFTFFFTSWATVETALIVQAIQTSSMSKFTAALKLV